jgi:cell fate (sporulation/competence/biofilm development) regulator YlbF (YheA/YmcA/DUF963 family)
MDEILELATKLGESIAADPRAKAMAAARTQLEESAADRQLLVDYQDLQQKLAGLEAEGKPIEAENKRQIADLHAKVTQSEIIKELLKAQTGYVELMSAVSRQIEEHSIRPSDSD